MSPAKPVALEQPAATTPARPLTMRAVVKARPGPGAEIQEVPVPTCGPGEVLIKVLRAGPLVGGAAEAAGHPGARVRG